MNLALVQRRGLFGIAALLLATLAMAAAFAPLVVERFTEPTPWLDQVGSELKGRSVAWWARMRGAEDEAVPVVTRPDLSSVIRRWSASVTIAASGLCWILLAFAYARDEPARPVLAAAVLSALALAIPQFLLVGALLLLALPAAVLVLLLRR